MSLNRTLFLFLSFLSGSMPVAWSFSSNVRNYEGSSDLVNLEYHMGPVLSSPLINLYIIWYGNWNANHQSTIRDFLHSLSPYSYSTSPVFPSVADWWQTVRLYADQTGYNITGDINLAGEFHDRRYSHGKSLTRLTMQSVIKNALRKGSRYGLPLDTSRGLYLVLTSGDVQVQDFCRAVCGFHYFTFPTIVGGTLPFAWVGYSGTQCPGLCAYPFALPVQRRHYDADNFSGNSKVSQFRAPNGDPGVDGMISVLAHELAEVSTNPLVNAWYAGDDPTAPTEIADLCMGVYGTGGSGGGGYVGSVYKDKRGTGYNVHGVKGRRFLIQWVWDPVRRRCYGPNAMD